MNRKKTIACETTIVLIDDVFTTGATLASAAQMLRQAGYKRIIAVTAAAPL
ncbi:MAG: phosphoribosyltransferase family protein [Candidatus Neomarinimicrobiota bacterium]